MSDRILDNIMNAASGQPYNGAGVSQSDAGQGSAIGVSGINGSAVNLDSPMRLTHSLDGIRPFELNENAK